MTTPNLALDHIAASQSQKEVTANEVHDQLDAALAGWNVINFESDADYTLDDSEGVEEHLCFVLEMTDTGVVLTASRDVVLPAIPKVYWFVNSTAQSLDVTCADSSSFTVASSAEALIRCDGASVAGKTL